MQIFSHWERMLEQFRGSVSQAVLVVLLLLPVSASGQTWSWTFQTVDTSGKFTAVGADDQGNLHLSYATDDQQLKYAFRPSGSSRWFTMVLDERLGEFFTSLTVDSAGNPHICYTPRLLKYARWDGRQWQIQEVGPRNGTIEFTCSVAVGPEGTPYLTWYQTRLSGTSYFHIKYAALQEGAWMARTLDFDGEAGKWSSIVIDKQGHPHIAFSAFPKGELRYAAWDGKAWNMTVTDSPRPGGLPTGMGCSLVVTPQNDLQVAFYEASVQFNSAGQGALKYGRQKGTAWAIETVDRISTFGGWVGFKSSLVLDQRGFPHISYEDAGTLKHAYWDGKQWRVQVIAPRGTEPYRYSGIAITQDDTLYISFRDPTDGSVKIAVGRPSPDPPTPRP